MNFVPLAYFNKRMYYPTLPPPSLLHPTPHSLLHPTTSHPSLTHTPHLTPPLELPHSYTSPHPTCPHTHPFPHPCIVHCRVQWTVWSSDGGKGENSDRESEEVEVFARIIIDKFPDPAPLTYFSRCVHKSYRTDVYLVFILYIYL